MSDCLIIPHKLSQTKLVPIDEATPQRAPAETDALSINKHERASIHGGHCNHPDSK